MGLGVKITFWLSLIPICLIPLYIIIRIPFTFTPIFARYISKDSKKPMQIPNRMVVTIENLITP